MAVTLTQLSAFLTVVRRGSVTAAAEDLFVTQPSVSAAVAALEREVGAKLLERDGRGLRPTEAGAAFAPYAAHVLGLLEQGSRAAREAGAGGRATLRISAVTSAGDHVVPPLIRAFRDAHPELDLVLHIGNRAEVFAGLLDHRADVAITGRVPDDERLAGEAFAVNEIVLVTAPDDPLAKRRASAASCRRRSRSGRTPRCARRRGRGSGSGSSRGRRRRWSCGWGCWARSGRVAACRSASGSSSARRSARRARRPTRSWHSWSPRRRGRCSTGCWRCGSGARETSHFAAPEVALRRSTP
jgi:DNA-binding transcriptional LysR family regulator